MEGEDVEETGGVESTRMSSRRSFMGRAVGGVEGEVGEEAEDLGGATETVK